MSLSPASTGSVKVVGRRRVEGDPLADSRILQRTLNRLRGGAVIPRGVYRFASHERRMRGW